MAGYDYDGATEVVAFSPSRENAEGALEMVRSFYSTVRRIMTEVIIVVDENDPQLAEYQTIPDVMKRELVGFGVTRPDPPRIMVVEGGSLTKATNEGVARIWDTDVIIGHVGDDHRFETEGWDAAIRDAILGGAYVAYTRDGFRAAWASAWWTPAIVPRTLGWLAVPGSRHLTIDDVFMDIGAGLGANPGERLKFLTDVTIRHLHPAGGQVPWRDIVKSHYTKARREEENANLERYRSEQFAKDITRLRDALGLPHYPVEDLSPGKTFRRNLRGEFFKLPEEPEPGEVDLEAINGGPIQGLMQRLKAVNAWKRQWRAENPGWDR